jgi:hypothetical protein
MLCADDVLRGLALVDRSGDFLKVADIDLLHACVERLRVDFWQRSLFSAVGTRPVPLLIYPEALRPS